MKQAVALVIKRGDKFLLIKRAKPGAALGYWCPITGAVEKGETQEQAIVREAQEEMGIKVKPIRKVWACPTHDQKYLLHWWSVKLLKAKVKTNPHEVRAYGWFDFEQMQKIDKMFQSDLHFFETIGQNLPEL